MARKSDEAGIHSSLALLQERFNQLQKTREMRQEKELMRLISEARERRAGSLSSYSSNCNSATMHYHQPSMLYDSELIFHQNKPSSQLALSPLPDTRMKRRDFGEIEAASQETESWLFGTSLGHHASSPVKFDDSTSDVDTSLHL